MNVKLLNINLFSFLILSSANLFAGVNGGQEDLTTGNVLIKQESQTKTPEDVTVSLMWVNRDPSDSLVPDEFHRNSKETSSIEVINPYERLDEWADHYKVNFWYDSALSSQKGFSYTQTKIDKECKNANRITLLDIRDLELVKANAQAFTPEVSLYYRLDLLRVIAGYEKLKEGPEGTMYVYSDFSIKPMPFDQLMDQETQENVAKYGCVMAKGPFGYENNFQVISTKPNALRAIKTAIIDRALLHQATVGKPGDQQVYNFYPMMYEVFYHLEGKGQLTKGSTGTLISYADLSEKPWRNSVGDLLKWFSRNDSSRGSNVKFEASDPSIWQIKEIEVDGEKIPYESMLIPIKEGDFPRSHFGI